MAASILPFSLAKSNEKPVDREAIALVDEFAEAIGLPEKVEQEFPAPGSNAGIDPSVYVRTLIYHFSEGGRHAMSRTPGRLPTHEKVLKGVEASRRDASTHHPLGRTDKQKIQGEASFPVDRGLQVSSALFDTTFSIFF